MKLSNLFFLVTSPCSEGQGDLAYHDFFSMPVQALELFTIEHSTWLRSLDHMEQECSNFKNDLSKILDSFSNEKVIHWADEYQGIILHNETGMKLLRDDIMQQKEHIASYINDKTDLVSEQTVSSQNALRTKIEYMEKEFLSMKNSFFNDVKREGFI